jgi:hypothetical protein
MKFGGKFLTAALGLVLLAPLAAAASRDDARILSEEELKAMEREDGMWRVLHVDEELPACVDRLRAAGYTAAEINAFEPGLREIWETTIERNFGWLQEETVEKIKAVDREFIARIRVARLRVTAGLALKDFPPADESTLNRQWRKALLRVLDYDEIAEFRLMNTGAAREASRLLQGISLTKDEQRVLFLGERDHARDYGTTPFDAAGSDWRERANARLDHYAAVREVLGPDRFAVYLERAAPDFAQMREALGGNPPVSVTAVIELWWLRKQREIAAGRKGAMTGRDRLALDAELQKSALQLLGKDKFAGYFQRDDARWLGPRYSPLLAGFPTSQPAELADPAAQ